MKKNILRVLLAILCVGFAGAQEAPQVFRDWVFERKILGETFGSVCVAYTDKKVGELNWRLNVVFSPDQANPAHIVMSTTDESVVNKVIYSQTDSSTQIQKHLRSDFMDAALGAKTFWFAPSSFTNFYSYLRRGSALKVKYTQGTEKQVLFSLMGSTAATNRIAELCNNKREFIPTAFYDYLDKVNINQEPVNSDASANNAWNDLGLAWDAYLETGTQQIALNDLQKKIDPLVAKEKDYLKQSGLLSQDIQNQEQTKKDLEALVVTQKAQLQKAQDDLAAQDVLLQNALRILKDKEDAFRPVREEGRPYFTAVDAAKQRVNTLNSQIASTQEQIRQLKIKINNLYAEASQLENKIRQQQQQLSNLKSERIRANNEYMSYNVEWEFQRKLNSDTIYQQRLNAKAQSDRDLVTKRNEVSRLETSVRRLESDLRTCQAQPSNDCSSIQQDLNRERNELNRAEQAYAQEQNQNRTLEQQIANRKTLLRNQTESEKQALANRVTDYDLQINQQESAISQNEFKLSTLRNSDIPRAEREESSAENTLLTQQGQLDIARDNLRRCEQDLASFKARTDYDRKEREYAAADQEVNSIRFRMAALDTQIKTLQSNIAKNQAKITTISANIEKLVSQLASTQTELQNVQAALKPLLAQKDQLTQELQAMQARMLESSEDFRVNIRDIPLLKGMEPKFPAKFHDWL